MSHNPEESQPMDFEHLVMRKNRPLPKPGCSWAFFIFLGLLTIAMIIMYVIYKQQ